MKDLAGKTAVVTGAASGMGLSFANRFADEGMNIVLADIESEPLAMAEAGIKQKGVKTLAVRTNVMHAEDINRLADSAFSTFGNVHVLCNNAGVAGGGMGQPIWEGRMEDFQWTFGVNFMGVLYAIRAFVPRMIENGEEGHIVNTASMAGMMPGANPYGISKFSVVCLTEGLFSEFKLRETKLSASVLCPGWVSTNILDSERNRPEEFGPRQDRSNLPPDVEAGRQMVEQMLRSGFAPEEVAERVLKAVVEDQLYIIPAQPYMFDAMRQRFDNIMNERNPVPQPRFAGGPPARN